MFGKIKDRLNLISFYEKSGLCSQCYKKSQAEIKQKEEQEKSEKKFATIVLPLKKIKGKEIEFTICLSDGTPSYSWICNNLKDFNKQSGEILKKVKNMGYEYKVDEMDSLRLKSEFSEIKELWNKSDKDIEKEIKELEQKEKQQAMQEKIKQESKPIPECFDWMKEKHGEDYKYWNRTIYGNRGGYNYYIKSKKYPVTDEQYDQIMIFQKKN